MEDSDVAASSVVTTTTAPASEEVVVLTKRPWGRPMGSSQKRILTTHGSDTEDGAATEGYKDADDGDVPAAFKNKFIQLLPLIPPHPTKGPFEVEMIRESLYLSSS